MSVEVLVPKPAPKLTAGPPTLPSPPPQKLSSSQSRHPTNKMKEQVRPATTNHTVGSSSVGGGRNVIKPSTASAGGVHPHHINTNNNNNNHHNNNHHHHPNQHHHHQPPPQHQRLQSSASGDNVRSTPDTTGHSPDIHQHFDNTHIIYDNTTDTTYLRGRLLGKGGFARCYELLSLNSNKIYAGKIISKSRLAKPHQKQKILREVQLQRNLKHRNVVEFHSYFEDDSNVYIILENCSRKSLVHVLKHRKCLTEPEVRYYLRQLVDGVDYIHSNHIIHRDLKLGNMLLNAEMELKLADFGLATRVDFAGEKKMTVCGTPNYIAPEVLQKKGHSFEADIWAVGCIAYAMLVGRPPFETTTLKETYLRITENNYILPPSLSTSSKNLIRRCLSAEPSARPTLQDIVADEFFTTGYLPRSLSPACCTSMPKFPSYSRYTNNSGSMNGRPLSYASPSEAKVDPMGRLGNALSQMHLDSRSENLLEEKELEDIEKKTPKQLSRNGEVSSTTTTTTSSTKANNGVNSHHQHPHQQQQQKQAHQQPHHPHHQHHPSQQQPQQPHHNSQHHQNGTTNTTTTTTPSPNNTTGGMTSAAPTPSIHSSHSQDGSLGGDRSRSPPQSRDKPPKPRSAAMLLEVMGSTLEHRPKGVKVNPPAVNIEITWVTKWVDYSNKYGFGFQLSSDALGVLFNDTSRIIMAPDGRAIQYYDVTGKLSAFTSDCVPEDLERKTTLLQYFARYMDEHLIQGGDLEYSSNSDICSWSGCLYLKKWFRTAKAIVLYLSDGTLQVNFFDDHTKLILSNIKNDYLVTYIDEERVARTFNLCHIIQDGCANDIAERMTFARSYLKNLVDIEGADI